MDPLKELMREVHKAMSNRHKPITLKGPPLPRAYHAKSPYTDPKSWKEGQLILLMHESGQTLGIFREKFGPFGVRRLSPEPFNELAALLSDLPMEVVTGLHWLEPTTSKVTPVVYTSLERKAMQARFHELLEGV
jgi:hypothetical protein